MPCADWPNWLRVLEAEVRRLGRKVETPVDVRVLAATTKDPSRPSEGRASPGPLFPIEAFIPAGHRCTISKTFRCWSSTSCADINAKQRQHVRGM